MLVSIKPVLLFAVLLLPAYVHARAVFAHFMVGNVYAWSVTDWQTDIALAQDAHIDAFVLNLAEGDRGLEDSISRAFTAAEARGLKLLFSFDYAGGFGWRIADDVTRIINTYKGSAAYYHYNNKPLVSTFEGPAAAKDWPNIKAQTGCFFIPSYSSLGAKAALALNVADGLFSWAGWPWGNYNMNTYVDASYLNFLQTKEYMMPVSPWFFTNLPGFAGKNWLWRGDSLWFDRWSEVMYLKPQFVQIISWNDYGESHHIGPIRAGTMDAFIDGKAPYNYALNMPHDGWRDFLPYLIDTYKNGIATVNREGVVGWYRKHPGNACTTGGTTGNTASQLLIEFLPSEIVQDRVFYAAQLSSSGATIEITFGDTTVQGTWDIIPFEGVGIYRGSVPFILGKGAVTIRLLRGSVVVGSFTGPAITSTCQMNIQNYNAWVGSSLGPAGTGRTPSLTIDQQKCIKGGGAGNFNGLCSYACQYGYCPVGACHCLEMGDQKPLPTSTGVIGYPAEGLDANYEGLCAFVCNLGYCPSGACGTVKYPLTIATTSPFLPPACVSGTGVGNLGGLCSFACGFGFCPMIACTCTAQGVLVDAPPQIPNVRGSAKPGLDAAVYDAICDWTCSRGYCPEGACGTAGAAGVVFIDPVIFVKPSPTLFCTPPCTLVIPPSTMYYPTIISFPPVSTSLVVGGSTISTIVPSPVTTTVISFFNEPIAREQTPFSFAIRSSLVPRPQTITVGIITTTVFFLPISIPANVPVATAIPVLPTTVYVKNGVAQPFSEAQFPELRSLTIGTVKATTFAYTETGGSASPTIIVDVTVSIEAGGFYWSPVPLPEFPPWRIPVLAEFPPFPTPFCFQLLNIFSVGCPPDKGLPTTAFAVGPAEPTCTVAGGCGGKLCTTNCYVTGIPPVADDCEMSTATNYWVSCASDSCTTTSSALTTGCYVTPTATTTGASCVRTGISTYEDQGDDGETPFPDGVPTPPGRISFPLNIPGGTITFVCFQDIPDFQEISSDAIAENAISGLCNSQETLYAHGPPVTYTIADLRGGGRVMAQVGWDHRTGIACESQRDMKISPAQCRNYLRMFIDDCIPRAYDKRYGGGFIQITDIGCIEWSIFAVPL